MSFVSLDFLVFFVLYALLNVFFIHRKDERYWFLTASSFVFYGWWDWRFLFLIMFSGLIDFFAAKFMNGTYRKWALGLSLAGNLGSLGIFKYSGFFAENINSLFGGLGLQLAVPEFSLILPVGISFYTFQSMSYSIDVYNKKLKPVTSLPLFFSYLAMFPQLVAGPIVRASDIIEQIKKPESLTESRFFDGLKKVVWGFFLKMVVADNLGPIVDASFSDVSQGNGWHWWLIMSLFSLQIYCDFNGYSLIAIGLARWMGFDFLQNFNHPYLACSFKDFWARWHISLSSWFRDYVYIPLGGNRVSRYKQTVFLWTTMVLSGLWHGASWNFLLWGALHAFYLTVEKIIGWAPKTVSARALAPILILPLVVISWVFFRAETLSGSLLILQKMFSPGEFDLTSIKLALSVKGFYVCLIFFTAEFIAFLKQRFQWESPIWEKIEPIRLGLAAMCCIYFGGPGGAFIYFQF